MTFSIGGEAAPVVTTGSIFAKKDNCANESDADEDEEDSDEEEEDSEEDDEDDGSEDGSQEEGSGDEEEEDSEDEDSEAEKIGKPPEWFIHMGRAFMQEKEWDHALEYLEEVEQPDARLLLDICIHA